MSWELFIIDEEIQKGLSNLSGKMDDLSPLMKEIAGIMMFWLEETFEQQGKPKWEELSSETEKAREKKGYVPIEILKATGNMFNSRSSEFTPDIAIVGLAKEYAIFHQLGTKHMAARPIFDENNPDMLQDIQDKIIEWLKD